MWRKSKEPESILKLPNLDSSNLGGKAAAMVRKAETDDRSILGKTPLCSETARSQSGRPTNFDESFIRIR